jgi:hypothetical protein
MWACCRAMVLPPDGEHLAGLRSTVAADKVVL